MNLLRFTSSALGPLAGFALYAYIIATFSNNEVVVWSQMLTVIWGIAALMSPFYFAAINSNSDTVQGEQSKLLSLLGCILIIAVLASGVSIIASQFCPSQLMLFICIALAGLARVTNEFVGAKIGTDGEQLYDTFIRVSPQLTACGLVYMIRPSNMTYLVAVITIGYAAAAISTLLTMKLWPKWHQVGSLASTLAIYKANRFGLYQALLSLAILAIPFQLFIHLSDLNTGATAAICLFLLNSGVMTLNISTANKSRDLALLREPSLSLLKTELRAPLAIALIIGSGALLAFVIFRHFKGFDFYALLTFAFLVLMICELVQTFACSIVNRLNNRYLLKFICLAACINGFVATLAPNLPTFLLCIALGQFLSFAVPSYFFILKRRQS